MCNRLLPVTGAVFLIACLLPAQQPSAPLTLQDCIRLAEAAPSAVTLARQDLAITARDRLQARAGLLPQARMVNVFTYNSPASANRDMNSFVALNGSREYAFLFNVNQEIDTSGRLRADYARARAGQDIAAAGLAITQRDLKRTVAAAYYQVVLARRVVRIAQAALAESRSFEARAKLLFAGGEAAQADVVKASAQAAFIEQALNTAELEAQLANQELASFWTRDVAPTLLLADILDEPPPAPEAAAPQGEPFLKRLEFRLFDARRRDLQAGERQARSALLPQLGAVFQYGIDSNAVRIADRGYAAFVNLNIPLFDWMKAHNALQAARLRTEQLATTRQISERTLSREYQGALARVTQLYSQIALTGRQAQLAEDDLRLSRVRYEGGEGSALDVVTSQNQYAQARTNYYTTMVNYLNARAALEVASGR